MLSDTVKPKSKADRAPRAKSVFRGVALGFDAKKFRRAVIAWFAKHARDLPWRRTTDPYAILVSEIMCQQTQVATVLPYYERWLRRFPDCETLAAATEHEVMSLWQGLGYYSRTRNLHKAAKAVVESGKFPRSVEEIRALPGVGRYTAGAIAAFAYDQPAALVDANIARVLARVFAVREVIDGVGLARVWEAAESLQGDGRGRAFNGGLMEIGGMICTPRKPRCDECPIEEFCEARAKGIQEDLPVKKIRQRTERVTERCALIVRDGQLLLEHQQGTRWNGLWKLPALARAPETKPALVIEYPFTHHIVTLAVYHRKPPRTFSKTAKWWSVDHLADVPMAAAHRRAAERLLRDSKSHGK
jgi:A/G-specific adenine glycosylase